MNKRVTFQKISFKFQFVLWRWGTSKCISKNKCFVWRQTKSASSIIENKNSHISLKSVNKTTSTSHTNRKTPTFHQPPYHLTARTWSFSLIFFAFPTHSSLILSFVPIGTFSIWVNSQTFRLLSRILLHFYLARLAINDSREQTLCGILCDFVWAANISTAFNHNDNEPPRNSCQERMRSSYNRLRFISRTWSIQKQKHLCKHVTSLCWRCSKYLGCFRVLCCQPAVNDCGGFSCRNSSFSARWQTTTINKHRNKSAEAARRVQEPKNRNQFSFQSNESETMDGEEMKN